MGGPAIDCGEDRLHAGDAAAFRERLSLTINVRSGVRQSERDQGLRGGLTTAERERIKELEREVRQLRQANEILRGANVYRERQALTLASAYFAMAELDRRSKT